MKTIILIATMAVMGLFAQNLQAQDINVEQAIEQLEAKKEEIKNAEREALKAEVESINEKVESGEITSAQAEALKKETAEKYARNIENRLAIVENRIQLLNRNGKDYGNEDVEEEDEDGFKVIIDGDVVRWGDRKEDREIKYDRRTYSDLVVAVGLNNAIIEGQSIDDTPYKIGGSRFFELGWAWKTRVFDNSNWLRIKYGFSFQWNGLKPDDNQYFVEDGDETILETYPISLDKSKFRMDNLVVPIHFEIGPSRKHEGENYMRYHTDGKFKLGFGGYAGLNLLTIQKLKYDDGGNDRKDKFKRNYNTNNFIYGLSGYIAFGDTAIYVKYDLNTIFKDNPVEQRNISLGLRFDMD